MARKKLDQPLNTRRPADIAREREMTDEALQENVRKLRALLNAAVDAIITIDQRGIITGVNPATEKMFGYTEEELLERNINILMPEPYRSEHDGYLKHYHDTGEAKIIGLGRELTARRKDGSVFPIELSVGEYFDGDGPMYTGIIHDISKRRELERHLAKVRDEEKQRVAQELHDGLGGQMTGIALLLKSMRKSLEAEGSACTQEAADLAQHVEDAHAQLRNISRGLSPVEVLPDGLNHALSALAERTDLADGFRCSFESDGVVVHQPSVSMHLYRIAQEAVSNAVRHGHTDAIEIQLEQDDHHVVLTVSNTGKAIQHLTDSTAGMGIRTMKHRADLIGGTLRVAPAEGGGTVVICRAPNKQLRSPSEGACDERDVDQSRA